MLLICFRYPSLFYYITGYEFFTTNNSGNYDNVNYDDQSNSISIHPMLLYLKDKHVRIIIIISCVLYLYMYICILIQCNIFLFSICLTKNIFIFIKMLTKCTNYIGIIGCIKSDLC